MLWITNVRNVSNAAQEAVVSANSIGVGAQCFWHRRGDHECSHHEYGATLTTFSGANIENSGKIQIQGGTLNAQYVDIRGGMLSGNGRIAVGSGPITGQVENHSGTIAPSDLTAGSTIGTLTIGGRLANDEAGTLAIDLGGPTAGTQYDRILVDNDVAIEGTLAISLVNLGGGTYSPAVGTAFTIITAGDGIGGAFDHVTGPDGYNWRVNYLANSVQLVVGNPGDFNNDGVVDARDYVVWRDTAGGPLNYAAWRSHFGTTYASGSSLGDSSVPEPASMSLLLVAGAFALRRGPCRRLFCLWFSYRS